MIKNIIFDMGNVLTRFDPHAIYRKFTESETQALELYHYLYDSGLWINLDKGIPLEEVLQQMLTKSPEKYHEAIKHIVYKWIDELEFDPKMKDLIFLLKEQGYRIYMLSNVSKQFYEFKEKNPIFDEFDGLYVSADSHLIKPDYAIFRDFLRKFRLNANECYFIDDHYENVQAAIDCDIRSYHYLDDFDDLVNQLERLCPNQMNQ